MEHTEIVDRNDILCVLVVSLEKLVVDQVDQCSIKLINVMSLDEIGMLNFPENKSKRNILERIE